MQYLYDSSGRLLTSAFAQTPQTGSGAPTSAPFYTSSYPAASRARAYYAYDPAGRVLTLNHWWDTWGGTSYGTPALIQGNACAYETSGTYNRGLKTSSAFTTQGTSWTENYGYDNNLDYLTSTNYGDGKPNATQSWTYDAAGNKASDYTGSGWSYDNLNRMTASPGFTYTNDILGNRTAKTPSGGFGGGHNWDCLPDSVALISLASLGGISAIHGSDNRLTQWNPSGTSGEAMPVGGDVTFTYRADGMRVEKVDHSGNFMLGVGEINDTYARYRYDGQMPFETALLKADNSTEVIAHGLGARGIDYVMLTKTPSGGSASTYISFPLYDAHGNEVETISRSGSSYSYGNQRSYGAWGEVRQGAATGGPRGRYCGNLGHVQDDESGLIYMRARYYEPTSGRFASEDPECQGHNWFRYCSDDPVNYFDSTGRDIEGFFKGAEIFGIFWGLVQIIGGALLSAKGRILAITGLVFLATWFNVFDTPDATPAARLIGGALWICWGMIVGSAAEGISAGDFSVFSSAFALVNVYVGILTVFIAAEAYEDGF